ncbi:MAG: nitroreductase family protein [Candidatus Omnitrophica bacterium]|nr:nitroreductase family protein [Candidatus Omnitrophota bacterium]
MTVYETILKRRTVRSFQPRTVPGSILEKMVNAGRLAPSAANLQPCEFLIVDEQDLIAAVFSTLQWAGYVTPAGNPPEGKRPVAYIVLLLNQEKSQGGISEAGAVIENMILTGLEEGVASCWLGSVDRGQLVKILNIPDYCRIDSVLALGYPDQENQVEDFAGSVKYWLDENGNFHVPKRSLKDVLHRNTY